MDPFYAAVNLCVLGALFAIVYAAGQPQRRRRILGRLPPRRYGEHFVILFRASPSCPPTCSPVDGGLGGRGLPFALTRAAEAVSVFAIASTAIAFLPGGSHSVARWRTARAL
ncbi:MAG: hypothetical protein ACLSVD_04645 [Eggerthellaceae bacterium]